MNVQQLISQLFEKDILITPEQVKRLTDKDALVLSRIMNNGAAVEQYLQQLESQPSRAPPPISPFTQQRSGKDGSVQVIRSYAKKPKKRSYDDFVRHFNVRFQNMDRMLRARKELAGVTAIDRVRQFSGSRDKISVIGFVLEKRDTKNEHIMLEIEDRSGTLNVLISKNKPELIEIAKDLAYDEIIGITGTIKDDLMFADSIVIPSVPQGHELKKAPEEVYMVCLSDIHFGNKNFFEKEFSQVVEWLNGNLGDDRTRDIARKTKYVVIAGDLIEGVGVYPSQEADLSIPDIYAQYRYCDEVLSKIAPDKHIILIPGNHDIGRLSEPQPRTPPELMPLLNARANTYFLSNPSWVRIHQTPSFPGFTILLYHGGSFFYYGNSVMKLFREGGMSNPVGIMQYLLTHRHLAPSHTSTLYVPDAEEDHLIIDEIPDFFITGHLHTTQSKTWNGITMLSCSCWVPLTEYQIKAGLKIDPGKFMLINLQTRGVQALKPEDLQ